MDKYKLLVRSAKQFVQVVSSGERVLKGDSMKSIAVIEEKNGDGVCCLIDKDGCIAEIGYDSEIIPKLKGRTIEKTVDASGKTVIPGLGDGHTHAVWAGDRVNEFAMKLAGANYMDVHKAGGGINFTVEHVRKASEQKLYEHLVYYLNRMMKSGTTLVECKSGYGLDTENEVKMLKVIDRANREHPMDISITYCGAHSVPKGSTAEEMTQDVIGKQIPAIKQLIQSGELQVDHVDVFCEKGVFDLDQSRRILLAGQEIGLSMNFHGEELNCMHAAEMGAELGALSISHLEEVSDEGIKAMAEAGCVAVILPATAYTLRLPPPRVRQMIEAGVPVALGTDFNPGVHCLSMPLVMHLACVNHRMSMNEALVASTINAAASMGRADIQGSLEVGKLGDMVILNSSRWEHLIYQIGGQDEVIEHVIKAGQIVHTNTH